MEGDKKLHAKLAQFIEQNAKLSIGDTVKAKEGIGHISTIGSRTQITNLNRSEIYYLVMMESGIHKGCFLSFTTNEIEAIEKVVFT
jgi:hypothetical protein